MIQVNIAGLTEALQKVPPFILPQMDEGTSYLFNRVYRAMANGETVRLSELDFSAFDEAHINSLADIYDDVLERNNFQAEQITVVLQRSAPIGKTAVYI